MRKELRKKVIHYGERTCPFIPNSAMSICNRNIRGKFSSGTFTVKLEEVTCKRCLKFVDNKEGAKNES